MVLLLPIFILFASGAQGEMMMMYHPPRVILTPQSGPMWYIDMSMLMYEKDTTGNDLEWIFEADEFNDDPWTYTVKINGEALTDHTEASWDDFVPIVVNIDGLALGDYKIDIQVNDSHTLFDQAAPYEATLYLEVVLDMPDGVEDVTTTGDPTNTGQNTDTIETTVRVRDGYPVYTLGFTVAFFLLFLIMRGARVKVSIDL